MHLIRFRSSVRVRVALGIIAGVALLAAACGGDDEAEPTPDEPAAEGTPIPTATPFARVPEPTIVASPTTAAAATAATPTADGDVEYIVELGDNLFGIAERYDTTVDAIMERNDIDDAALIFVGQVLIVPQGHRPAADDTSDADDAGDDAAEDDESETTTTTDDSGRETYVVQAGDTAYGIALQFDVTLEELAAANGTTVEELANLFEGDELVIP